MTIRPAALSDAAQLADIYAYYVENYPYSFEYTAPSAEDFAGRIEAARGAFPFFVCEEGDELLGFAYAHPYKERKAVQWIVETTIYVRYGCEHRGIGTLLYGQLLPALKSQGFTQALAILGCPNEGSEAFHEAMGFSLLATFPDQGYKFGRWHDVKFYALDLNPAVDNMVEPLPWPIDES